MPSKLFDQSDLFAHYWRLLAPDMPDGVAEYRFAPPRRWKFDFAIPACLIAVEVEGGAWTHGRHTRGKGFEDDCDKYGTATARGWRVFRFTPGMLNKDPEKWVNMVYSTLIASVPNPSGKMIVVPKRKSK